MLAICIQGEGNSNKEQLCMFKTVPESFNFIKGKNFLYTNVCHPLSQWTANNCVTRHLGVKYYLINFTHNFFSIHISGGMHCSFMYYTLLTGLMDIISLKKVSLYNIPSWETSKPSGFIVGIIWILVLLTRVVMRGFLPYPSNRYCIRNTSISRLMISFPCMFPMYLNSGSPIGKKRIVHQWEKLEQNCQLKPYEYFTSIYLIYLFIYPSTEIAVPWNLWGGGFVGQATPNVSTSAMYGGEK